MDIRVATLCDFAQVREGLLFVSSAGITRVYRESFPAPIGVMLALVLGDVAGGSGQRQQD